MSRQALRALISFGSVSFAFAIAAVSLPFMGCSGYYEDFAAGSGTCEDDKNPCTIDKCATGVTVYENAANGTLCALGGNAGKCDNGKCALDCVANPSSCECTETTECPAGSFCQAWACDKNAGKCTKTAQNVGMAVGEQTAGDCQQIVCAADGNTTSAADDNDAPMPEECFSASCMSGQLAKAPLELGAACGVGVCDGKGICVDCLPLAEWTSCGEGNCAAKLCNGETCTASTECKSALCVDGICCESECKEECKSCAVEGKLGTCDNIPVFEDDISYVSIMTGETTDCLATGKLTCNGTGSCLKLGGSSCASNDECVSGQCKTTPNMSKFCKGLTNEPCNVNTDCDSSMCVGGVCK